jgi:SRSO17 transposase
MDGGSSEGSEARFAAYVEALGAVLGHVDRQQPMHDYCLGLLMPIERKSVEPMAAVTAPAAGRLRPGSSTTRAFLRRGGIRSG